MSWLEQIDDVLQRYKGASTSPAPTQVSTDFAKVATHAPSSALSSGLTEAFRSQDTPPFGQMVSELFARSSPQQRAGILDHLIPAAGPAAGGWLGKLAGQFSGAAPQTPTPLGRTTVTPEQAQQVAPETVGELAHQAQTNDPSIVERASEFYAQHPQLVQGLGAAALALIMSHVSQRR
jgi:hypothetical protein